MMPILTSFCCCCSTRDGTILSGFYTMFMAVISMSLVLIQFSDYPIAITIKHPELSVICYSSLGVYSLLILASFALIASAHLDKKCVFLPWVICMTGVVICEVAVTVMLTAIELDINDVLQKWDIFFIVFSSLRILTNIYCILCVFSQYQVLLNMAKIEHDESKEPYIRNMMTYLAPDGASTICVEKASTWHSPEMQILPSTMEIIKCKDFGNIALVAPPGGGKPMPYLLKDVGSNTYCFLPLKIHEECVHEDIAPSTTSSSSLLPPPTGIPVLLCPRRQTYGACDFENQLENT